MGDEIWIYYGGMGHTHGHPMYHEGKKTVRIKSGIGLATLRLDGWVSIDAGKDEGTLTTKSLIFESGEVLKTKTLVINAKATGGSVVTEILDESGRSLSGFAKADCDALESDAVRHTITWNGQANVSKLASKTVRLRFHLQDAKLYSFSFKS